jgi:cell division initiation protein
MPIDMERPNLRKRFRGYDTRMVDALLRGAARSMHELRMENEALRERLAAQFDELERARNQERVVTDVLTHAQRTADETRAAAHRQAEALVEEARLAALAEKINGQRELSECRLDLERLREERVRAEREIRALVERILRDLESPNRTMAVIETPTLRIVEGEAEVAGA